MAGEFAEQIAGRLRALVDGLTTPWRILGPAPAPIAKLRGQYRFQVQVQGVDADALRAAVRQATDELKPPEGVQFIADVDPLDML